MMRMIHTNTFKYITIFIGSLVILLCLRWAWSEQFYTSQPSRPVDGVLDMRGVDLDKSSSFFLDGQWQLYPGTFVSHEDIQGMDIDSRLIQVPGDWESVMNPDSGSSYGYGTYRLRILIDPLRQPVTFWFSGIQASSEVIINGNEVGMIGQPAANAGAYKPFNVPYTASYGIVGTTEIELLIRVANFDEPFNGGITRSIRFGPFTQRMATGILRGDRCADRAVGCCTRFMGQWNYRFKNIQRFSFHSIRLAYIHRRNDVLQEAGRPRYRLLTYHGGWDYIPFVMEHWRVR